MSNDTEAGPWNRFYRRMPDDFKPATRTLPPLPGEDVAAKLYAKPTSRTKPAARPPRSPEELFYGGNPERDLKTIYRKYEPDLYDIGLTAADLAHEQQVYAATVRELQVTATMAQQFYGLWAEARVHRAKHPEAVEAFPTQMGEWIQETRQSLRERHGPEDADAWLAKVETFIAAVPLLGEVLGMGGLQYRKGVVEALVQHLYDHPEQVTADWQRALASAEPEDEDADADEDDSTDEDDTDEDTDEK